MARAAIDDDEVGKGLLFVVEAPIAATDDFFHGAEVVVADEGFNFVAAVILPIRPAVFERDHGGDAEAARDVRNVEALHPLGDVAESQICFQLFERFALGGRIVQRAFELSGAHTGLLQRGDPVAQLRGFFVVAAFGRGLHLVFELGEPLLCFAIEKGAGGIHACAIVGLAQLVGVLVDLGAGVVIQSPLIRLYFDGSGVAKQDAEFFTQGGEGLA